MLFACAVLYALLHRSVRVWDTPVFVRSARVFPMIGNVLVCLYVSWRYRTCQPVTSLRPRPIFM